jgi:hypothetical protein
MALTVTPFFVVDEELAPWPFANFESTSVQLIRGICGIAGLRHGNYCNGIGIEHRFTCLDFLTLMIRHRTILIQFEKITGSPCANSGKAGGQAKRDREREH